MKKIIALTLTVLLLVTALVGCGASRDASVDEKYAYAYDYATDAPAEYGYLQDEMAGGSLAVPTVDGTATVSANRKLIRTVSLSVETEEYDVLLSGISERLTACGGYVESLSADTRYSSDSRYATMTVRVPAERLDEFVTAVSGISNVVQRSEDTEDVTLAYVDMESHTNALRTEQERLIALLEEAENLTEILEIESRLTDVRYELEYMESQLRTYDNLVDYATVTLSVSEVKVLTPTEEKGFWEKIGDGFKESLADVWEGIKSLFSFLIIAIPYLLVIAVITGIVLTIIFLCLRKSRKKAAQRTAAYPQQPPVIPPQPPVNFNPEQNNGQ